MLSRTELATIASEMRTSPAKVAVAYMSQNTRSVFLWNPTGLCSLLRGCFATDTERWAFRTHVAQSCLPKIMATGGLAPKATTRCFTRSGLHTYQQPTVRHSVLQARHAISRLCGSKHARGRIGHKLYNGCLPVLKSRSL